MPPKEVPAGYRRNGKKQSCEPCRKGKLACDHGSPFCGRCVRRKMTTNCIYHPAPMTRGTAPLNLPTPNTSPGVTSEVSIQTNCPHECPKVSQNPSVPYIQANSGSHPAVEGSTSNQLSYRAASKESEVSSPQHPKTGWQDAVFKKSSVYLGPTSYSAIFLEHQNQLQEDLLDIGEGVRKHPGAWQFGQPLLGRLRPNGPTMRTREAVLAVWNIPPLEICEMLLAGFNVIRGSIIDPAMVKYGIEGLYSNFEKQLAYPRSDDSLMPFVDVLFDNEEHPLPPCPDDGIEWINTFTGQNIRFEMVGLLFCYFGMAYLTLQDWDPLFKMPENMGRDRKQTAWRMKECAEVCLKMCDYSETVNYLVPALISNLKRLETGCTGDETYHARRIHGDLVTTTLAVGLHRLPNLNRSEVTAASEFKRQLFCSVYSNDKTHASLNGTPPFLTRLFCDVQLCLDLPKGALFLPRDELAQIIDKLDPNGWSTSGDSYNNSTILRAKCQLSFIREEILELAIGINTNISIERISDLHRRCQETYGMFPYPLHYYSSDKTPKSSTGSTLYDQAYILLFYLQNIFFIDRVAIARGFANEQGILATSMEMIEVSLMFWMKRDQLMSLCSNFDWIITYYGIPSAGVICIELLKLTTGQSSIEFSRSDAIQKLTLFIAFLEWVRPTDGNYALAQRLRNVIRRVLDHVLDPSQHQPRQHSLDRQTTQTLDNLFPIFGEMEDLDWLNTIDWTQGSWMDFT